MHVLFCKETSNNWFRVDPVQKLLKAAHGGFLWGFFFFF